MDDMDRRVGSCFYCGAGISMRTGYLTATGKVQCKDCVDDGVEVKAKVSK